MNIAFSKELTEIVLEGSLFFNESMKKHTSFKLGGNADILIVPSNEEEVCEVIKLCKKFNYPFFVMGNGSNLIVKDGGIRGLVIKMTENFSKINITGEIVESDSGVLLSKLSKFAMKNDLSGIEFAEGIPGTLGGAVIMNAGAYNGEMKDVVVKTRYIDKNGDVQTIEGEEHKFSYRSSYIQKESGIILKSWLKLKKGNKEQIAKEMNEFSKRRRDKQPLEMPSAGSVFKRPEGYFAGKLIEDCGLRGFTIGEAQVSEKHCGFIVNKGNASSEDVIKLIKHIQNCVKNKYNVILETEVKIVGED